MNYLNRVFVSKLHLFLHLNVLYALFVCFFSLSLSLSVCRLNMWMQAPPITNQHYIAAPKGEIYGADHGIARFNVELNATIRPQTPIKNLFLTGEFVLSKFICMPSRSSFWDSFHALHFCICFSWCLEWRMCNVPWFIPILFQIWTLLTGQDVMLCGFAGALAGALDMWFCYPEP